MDRHWRQGCVYKCVEAHVTPGFIGHRYIECVGHVAFATHVGLEGGLKKKCPRIVAAEPHVLGAGRLIRRIGGRFDRNGSLQIRLGKGPHLVYNVPLFKNTSKYVSSGTHMNSFFFRERA